MRRVYFYYSLFSSLNSSTVYICFYSKEINHNKALRKESFPPHPQGGWSLRGSQGRCCIRSEYRWIILKFFCTLKHFTVNEVQMLSATED